MLDVVGNWKLRATYRYDRVVFHVRAHDIILQQTGVTESSVSVIMQNSPFVFPFVFPLLL